MTSQPAADRNPSLWQATAEMPACSPLQEDVHADVCVVGAGIAGLTTAYLLTRAGKAVVVLDDGPIGGGETAVTTAHLASAIDDRYAEIERLHGTEGARRAAESHAAAIDRIEAIAAAEGIDCDFERLDGYLFLSPGDKEDLLNRELDAAHRAGMRDVTKLPRAPLASFDTGPCLRFPRQGQFHPLKYLAGLARAILRDGGRIFTDTHADAIAGGTPARVEAGGHVVTAPSVVVATNVPVNDLLVLHTKQAPYMTYAIGARVPRGVVAKGLYWDTQDPYHYVRLQALPDGDDLLIVGGEDHKSGQADDTAERYGRLEAWARERFPMMGRSEFAWAGQVMETVDGLAFIGRNPMDKGNVYVATGDSGMGMTHGTIAGMLLTDLILGRDNPWATLYDPTRKTLRALGTFLGENLNVAVQYADWLAAGDVASADEVAPGNGGILRRGVMGLVAVYRDLDGAVHECSAVCPHLGCIVHWNAGAQTWDCPCHGSRFDPLGKVINGPANTDLPPAEGG